MSSYTQANRPLLVATPLGNDVLLLLGMSGHEGISQLFSYQLDVMAEDPAKVKFEKLLGQPIIVALQLPGEKQRYFSGVCSRVSQGGRDDVFTYYRLEVVPALWFLTKIARSRIFQHLTVPEILQKVLQGLKVSFELQGTFYPRDFCVQYRETDFNFASRLMEEEGIFYFFKHSSDNHQLVIANTPNSHAEFEETDQKKIIYEELFGGVRDENRIHSWEKTQELRSGKYTLWDHCFELPYQNLQSQINILDTVTVGTVEHQLKLKANHPFEIYDYPGAYAQRFDGVEKGGGDQSSDLSKIFQDNERTTKIRMEQETVPGLVIRGSSNCRHLSSGYKFTLDRHWDADGDYVLTSVTHSARLDGAHYRSGDDAEFTYENTFTCIPLALPFVPPQIAIKPTVQGTQTALVVGPKGEEIFTDKYGRVKVQFNWDREGKLDADSSCWVRVAHPWAGKRWGTIFIPRIGMEVVVDFLEGDPDRPIIVGCVYNADMMPPYTLPDEMTKSTTKTMSSKGGEGFNEIRFEDKKGKEQVFIHGEKDQDIRIKNDRREWIGNDRHLMVIRDKRERIQRDEENLIERDQIEEIGRDHHLKIKGKEAIEIDGSHSFKVTGDVNEKFSNNHNEETGMSIHVKAGMKLILEAGMQISLKVAGNFIDIGPAGVSISGTMVMINSGGAAGSGPGASPVPPTAPKKAEIADNANPGSLSESYKTQRAALSPVEQASLSAPWHNPKSDENKEKKSWIEIVLEDEAGKPVPGEAYRITLPDGTTLAEGTLDEKGFARVDNIDPGTCKVTFPNLDKEAWEPK
jgi:type VI secretion system secreted protein VgrG